MPSSTILAAGSVGSGSIAALILRWLLSVATAPSTSLDAQCQPVIDAAFSALHESSVGLSDLSDPFKKLDFSKDAGLVFLAGVCVGCLLGPLLDLLHLVKCWWWAFVSRHGRAFQRRARAAHTHHPLLD